jgi:signal transduction histidine kinase
MTSLSKRLVMVLLAIHAVLLPALFFALSAAVRQNMVDAFIDDARVQGRLIADNLELDKHESDNTLIAQLDSAMLAGRIVHASIGRGDDELESSLMSNDDLARFEEDFEFGDHGDGTYYLALPIVTGEAMAILHLGFDETQTQAYFEDVQRWIIVVLVVYLFGVLVASMVISQAMTRSLRWLQKASHSVALGDYDKQLQTDSKLVEIHDLTRDLEQMRSNLVKVNNRLRHAQRLESLGTLAGGVAHEFNNVLQPMLLYTDLALEDLPPDSPIAEQIRSVKDLAGRARGLSHQILTFGRIGADVEREVVNIAPVVQEAIAMIRALIPATVYLSTNIRQSAGKVRCNPAEIQQLVVNLCNNSLKALSTGDGHIRVSISPEVVSKDMAARYVHLDAGDYAVLRVSDTGCGMDEETLQRVYEPFFTTQEVGQGTGLGLSVVHGIVRRHEGEIILTSEPGKGTTFRVFLPRA